MSRHLQNRPSIAISIGSQAGSPASPSALFPSPRSPNSWTARSFTTLRPSDSPSQAQFPKHSQASLLLEAQKEKFRATGGKKKASTAKKQTPQASFLKRNFQFIALATVFHIALIVVTTLLVLIITAATSKPPEHIRPGYYIGVIVSFAMGLASSIVGYVKWNERKTSSASEAKGPDVNAVSQAELGLALSPLAPKSPMDDLRAVVSNWEQSAPAGGPQHLRALMASRNPLPSASARIAGSNNRMANAPVINDQGIELQSLHHHHQPHQRHEPATNTALELQRFLDHELQRQELIKGRISNWLQGIASAQETLIQKSASQRPQPKRHRQRHRPPPLQRNHSPPSFTPIPSNPTRLAQINAEIEAYLGVPIPPLPLATAPDYRDANIDYSSLPPAIPRPNAKARDVVLSDPTTVVYVGPERPIGIKNNGQSSSRGVEVGGSDVDAIEEVRGTAGSRGVEGKGREEVDDFAERWMERIMRGVEVQTVVPASGKKEKRGWWRKVRFW
ncbi:MAG: hypothetical protein Q9225_002437 [Loekoesia sp. 1 TL-2023]